MQNTVKMKCILASGLAAAIVALTPIRGHASDWDMASTAVVSYADLNLSTEAGARTLYFRLTKAADQVCPDDSTTLDLHRIYKTCVNEALGKVVRNMNIPTLSKLYTVRTGLAMETRLSMISR